MQSTLAVIEAPEQAAAMLHPLRRRILERLRSPDTAAGVARALGLPRQRIGHHVRELEREGLLETVEQRVKGNCVERVLRATARQYVVSPTALGELGVDPERLLDRFSSAYLVAAAARTIREVGELRRRAAQAGKELPTLSLEVDVRFASPGDQAAFARELTASVSALAARYHEAEAPGGRTFRFVVGGHPAARGPSVQQPREGGGA